MTHNAVVASERQRPGRCDRPYPRAAWLLALALAACAGDASEETETSPEFEQLAAVVVAGDPSVPLPIALAQGADPLLANLNVPSDAPSKGAWSATQSWPLNGLHSVLLPNGRVLTYGTPTGNASTQDGRYFDVWDPAQGFAANSHQTSFRADQVNSFCSSAAFLADGRLLVSGGNSPLESSEFTPADNTIARAASRMADERWYGTMIALTDGRLLMVGGSAPYAALRAFQDPVAAINGGSVSMTPELYVPGSGWRSLFGAYSREAFGPDFHRYWYPRCWVAPNGEVFGVSSEKMWYLNPAGDGAIRVAGNFKTGVNNSTLPNIGPTSSAVMFAPGRILQVGGNGYYDGHATPSSARATIIDINGASPALSETASMSIARQWANATVLPDGRVAVTGGTRYANNGGADAVYEAELWNPSTGSWTTGARAAQIRVYHSAAILMPNGAVLSTGSGAPGPVNNLNAELYYPPYLFRTVNGTAQLAPRPALTAISALGFAHGELVEFDMASAGALSQVVLIGTSSVTHSFNTTQRFQRLVFAQNGTRVAAGLPERVQDAPPGYYQLIAIDAAGVPSSGVIIAIGPGVVAPPVPTLLTRGAQVTFSSVSDPESAIAVDAAGLGVLKLLGPSPSAADLASAQFVLRDGFADSSCVSLESVQTPGRWLRHANYRLELAANDGSATFRNDATFCPEPGLADTGITLRSYNFPANVVRHRNGQLWVDPVASDVTFQRSASFSLRLGLPAIAAPAIASGASASYAPQVALAGVQYSWDFGDGSAPTEFAASAAASHVYAAPGVYLVTLTARAADGRAAVKTFVQAVYAQPSSGAPRASSALLLEPRGSAAARLWTVNPDNDSVSVFDTGNNTRVREITVGSAPRSLALAPNGRVWVVNRDSASISMIDPSSLNVAQTVNLPRASQPYGIVFAPNGSAAFVTLEGTGRLLKLNASSGAQLGSLDLGAQLRHLSIEANSGRLLVSRFVTPPLPGESTAAIQTTLNGVEQGGQVLLVNASALSLTRTITLRHSDHSDSPIQGRGLPNYLGAAVFSPDGRSAWLPSKQDNLARGTLRDGQNLNFENTVRAISARVDLATLAEDYAARVDHDNAGVASAAAFHPNGAYLFVALETSRQVAVLDAAGKRELFRVEVGRAPQALAVSSAGTRLYAHNFMDRSVSVVDLGPLLAFGEFRAPVLATLGAVGTEKLSAQVLKGKQLFYDARDTRLARDAYISCASCHNDGAQDGRVWDLTGHGEGLRNTIRLRGRAGAQSLLHWSGNFNEVQDFEKQIRVLAGGTGLMTDAAYNTGTRNQPLGDSKAGVSADLDALAAYVKSLGSVSASPWRNSDGTLTSAANTGRQLFASSGCPQCHNGSTFADEGQTTLRNIGTLKPSSGQRLGAPLTGIDSPTLRDVWSTAPFLHDGSAATIAAAISAHNTATLSGTNLSNLAAYVQQIDASEPGFAPSGLTHCANEGRTCSLPSGRTATVYFGANNRFFSRQNVTGSIACNTASFGDPIRNTSKTCSYR